MDTSLLERFAKNARISLIQQVSSKLEVILLANSLARRENPDAIAILEQDIETFTAEYIIDKVAYTWFNRFCALSFMDIKGYASPKIITPSSEEQIQPEILAEAKAGFFDDKIINASTKKYIQDLLSGRIQSQDAQNEVYRLLLVSACNYWHKSMPYMFQEILDYTELLLPDDLLSSTSIIAEIRKAMTYENCKDVEVLGWLYQYYISEKKDEIFINLRKNIKVPPKDIPAATQLFTPNWIVRYLLDNSLGRLWLLNRPNSSLAEKMEYYIPPQEEDLDFYKIPQPEEIKICDPACGSGHMLVYAFDLMYNIYEEEGINPSDIPQKIIENNLYGIEIDERAGGLASFALAMKARQKDKNFLNKNISPQICILEDLDIANVPLPKSVSKIDKNDAKSIVKLLSDFEDAKNYGSLINPSEATLHKLAILIGNKSSTKTVEKLFTQAEYLKKKYHIVIANPPYMVSKNMNVPLANWGRENYPISKTDLFSMFIERGLSLTLDKGYSAMVTMQSWMFLTTFEKLRSYLIKNISIEVLAHFDIQVMRIGFGTSATVFKIIPQSDKLGAYFYVDKDDIDKNTGKPIFFPPANPRNSVNKDNLFILQTGIFENITGSPISYWASEKVFNTFKNPPLHTVESTKTGLQTGNTERFLRLWHEVSYNKINFSCSSIEDTVNSNAKWFPCNKGGEFRRWYGNSEYIINFENNGYELKNHRDKNGKMLAHVTNTTYYFKPALVWTLVSANSFSMRYLPEGFISDIASCSIYSKEENRNYINALLNSKVTSKLLELINPTINSTPGNIGSIPYIENNLYSEQIEKQVDELVSISKEDWDSYELSWNFLKNPLIPYNKSSDILISDSYNSLRQIWNRKTYKIKQLEEENNSIFSKLYDLEDEIDNEVSLKEITIKSNLCHRYKATQINTEIEEEHLADTIKELVSYAIGCMFGRYSLDKDGIILASAGEGTNKYYKQIPNPSFSPSSSGIIPILTEERFEDDIVRRFKTFIISAFGEKFYSENMNFIENALNKGKKANYSIRDYFIKDFYSNHIKTYKKLPIYWLFTSPKGTFNALVYLHSYKADTISILLNSYLRELIFKLNSDKESLQRKIESNLSTNELAKLERKINTLNGQIKELNDYEKDIIYPLATQRIEIELDDGIKVNYAKFSKALKKLG